MYVDFFDKGGIKKTIYTDRVVWKLFVLLFFQHTIKDSVTLNDILYSFFLSYNKRCHSRDKIYLIVNIIDIKNSFFTSIMNIVDLKKKCNDQNKTCHPE